MASAAPQYLHMCSLLPPCVSSQVCITVCFTAYIELHGGIIKCKSILNSNQQLYCSGCTIKMNWTCQYSLMDIQHVFLIYLNSAALLMIRYIKVNKLHLWIVDCVACLDFHWLFSHYWEILAQINKPKTRSYRHNQLLAVC